MTSPRRLCGLSSIWYDLTHTESSRQPRNPNARRRKREKKRRPNTKSTFVSGFDCASPGAHTQTRSSTVLFILLLCCVCVGACVSLPSFLRRTKAGLAPSPRSSPYLPLLLYLPPSSFPVLPSSSPSSTATARLKRHVHIMDHPLHLKHFPSGGQGPAFLGR
jgi:hypothetical protein